MENANSSIFERAYDPVKQAALVLGGALVVMIGALLIRATGLMAIPPKFFWMTSGAFMLFFAMFNSIYALSTKDMMKYWSRSIYSYLGLAVISGLLAYLFSSLSINEAGSYRWIYVVLTVGYLIFLSIMTSVRRIVEFAMREEWNQPRIRQKKRK